MRNTVHGLLSFQTRTKCGHEITHRVEKTLATFPQPTGIMKPLLRLSVSVWALLVFSALLKVKRSHSIICITQSDVTLRGLFWGVKTGRFVWRFRVYFYHADLTAPVAQVAAGL